MRRLKREPQRKTHTALGLSLYMSRRFEEALAAYDSGLRLAPDDPELRNGRGVALLELRRPAEARDDFERALAADPDCLDALGNLGNALLKLNRPEEALAAYDRALKIVPNNAQLLTNRAVALRRLDRPQEALMSAARALAEKPDFAQARFVAGVARLTLGDFAAGWRGYEARWSVGTLALQRRDFAAPQWRGTEPFAGKTILLHAEQGFGDAIQFMRYAPLVAARGAHVVLEVRRELMRLAASLLGVATMVAHGDALPPFDYHCPLFSLPLAFATHEATIPAGIPYLRPVEDDVAAWRARLPLRRPLVGLCWSGERTYDNDINRSLTLATLAPLIDVPGAQFVSLQRDVRDADTALLARRTDIVGIGQQFTDFADTAAAIAALDLVISVDTAVAHLAGAIGKPLFLLLPFAADFRWLRERCDSPWYPSARLFRQPRFGDWASVVEAVRTEVQRLLNANPPSSYAGLTRVSMQTGRMG
ncbi:MAG TPA: tetratricopeptide repeat protein [Xanthobacteraceae bacterium]|nr:tetratricopeptide repeat protein [Xanthobacteraceae bacterium]